MTTRKQFSNRIVWVLACVGWFAHEVRAQTGVFPPPSGGGASSCGTPGVSWLNCVISGSTLNLSPASGQTNFQVIGSGSGGSFAPVSLSSSYLPLSSMGTITGGTWSGSIITGAYGGSGVNNGSFTETRAGNVTYIGAFNPTFAISSSSTWTFPSGGGTLVLTGGDINTSNQVTSTHLGSALPFAQGGLGTSSNFAAHNWFGNNTGSTAAPSAQQPACADLSNAANSCSTDATNASNISSGTLGTGRLPNSTGYAVIAGNGGASTVTSGAAVYYGAGVATSSGTEITRSTVMPFACTLRDFILITTGTQSAGGGSTSLVATVRVALASPSSGPVINVSAGASAGPYSDSTDTATVAAGQAIDIQITNNGSSTSAGVGGWSIGCVPN